MARTAPGRLAAERPKVEPLEDRTVPSGYDAVLSAGQADLRLNYANGSWGLKVRDLSSGVEYDPGRALLAVSPAARIDRPAGAQFDFLGVADTPAFDPVDVLPQQPAAGVLSVGVSAQGVPAGTFLPYFEQDPRVFVPPPDPAWVKLTLTDVRGPGHVSAYETEPAGGLKQVWLSTADEGIASPSGTGNDEDSLFLVEGTRQPYNWSFSKPGHYEVTVVASALVDDNTPDGNGGVIDAPDGFYDPGVDVLATSAPATFHFYRAAGLPHLTNVQVNEHIDLGFDFRGVPNPGLNSWEVTAEVGGVTPPPQFPPDEVLLFAGPKAKDAALPSNPQFAFLGAAAGEPVYVLPQTQNFDVLYLGVAVEETAQNTFFPYVETDPRVNNTAAVPWVRVSLKGVRGPAGGQFALWSSTPGGVTVWMASADGITPSDATFNFEGGHLHFNWGFTKPGVYEVDLEASAFLEEGVVTRSGSKTFLFSIDAPNAAPVNALPPLVATTRGTPVAFSGADAVSVSDPDGHPNPMQVKLTASNGAVSLGSLAGLTVTGGANNTAALTVRGRLADLNAALATLSFAPAAGFTGDAAVTVETNDLGYFYADDSDPSDPDPDSIPDNFRTDTDTVTVRVVPVAQVAAVRVNDGSAQRSRVTSLAVTFNTAVSLPADPADAFRLDRDGGGTVALAAAAVSVAGGRTTVLLTFGGPGVEAGSLADGRYTLRVFGAQVTGGGQQLDGDGDGAAGGDFATTAADKLFRLFGDSDGDADVDFGDFQRFRAAMGTTLPANLAAFDSDGDGDIDAADYAAFRARLGRQV